MLKKILYILMFLSTAVRLVGVVGSLASGNTSLPTVVLATTSLTVAYGVLLLVRRFVFTIRLRHFMQFFAVQSLVFAFNLVFVSHNVLLELTPAEFLAIGSVLDIFINCVAIYCCAKSIRRIKFSAQDDWHD